MPASNDVAARLTCPPYDVVSRTEAADYIAEQAQSFMTVIRPDAVMYDVSPYDDSVYAASKNALQTLVDQSQLVRDTADTLYVYRQQMGHHIQQGLVTLAHVQDYDSGVILQHEKTRKEKEDDRTRLTDELGANTGPVFLTYRDQSAIDEIILKTVSTEPLFDVTAKDEVRHMVWRVAEADVRALVALFDTVVEKVYIADGHHRSASAARVARNRATQAGDECSGNEDFNWFLVVLFPQSQLKILPYNRVVTDRNKLSSDDFLEKLRSVGEVSKMEPPTHMPKEAKIVFVYTDSEWYKFSLADCRSESCSIADGLDCSLLQHRVLFPILGIEDPRRSERIEFVGGIRGLTDLEKRADATDGVAFALHAVDVAQLMEVSDNNEIMPPKSTWFEPKLRSGLELGVSDRQTAIEAVSVGDLLRCGIQAAELVYAAVHGHGQAGGDCPRGTASTGVAQQSISGERSNEKRQRVKHGSKRICNAQREEVEQRVIESGLNGSAPPHALREAQIQTNAPETGTDELGTQVGRECMLREGHGREGKRVRQREALGERGARRAARSASHDAAPARGGDERRRAQRHRRRRAKRGNAARQHQHRAPAVAAVAAVAAEQRVSTRAASSEQASRRSKMKSARRARGVRPCMEHKADGCAAPKPPLTAACARCAGDGGRRV
ncbi:hypothetical protein FGB62_30g323 [Gracilaria domingensis]|nr:hypothetical protein FGB62_30g323 [Gracilaria domingensis]